MKYSQTLIDDKYKSGNIASQKNLKAFLVISILITLGIPIYQLLNKLRTPLSLTQQKFKGIIGDDMGIK